MSNEMRKLLNLMENTNLVLEGLDQVKSKVIVRLRKDGINTLDDWYNMQFKDQLKLGKELSELFYESGWLEGMVDYDMVVDAIEQIMQSQQGKPVNDNDQVILTKLARYENIHTLEDWKRLPNSKKISVLSLLSDDFYNLGLWDGMEDYHAFNDMVIDILSSAS